MLLLYVLCTNMDMSTHNDDNVKYADTTATDRLPQNTKNVPHKEPTPRTEHIYEYRTEASEKRIQPLLTTSICLSSQRQEYFKAHHCRNKTRRRHSFNKWIIVNDERKIAYCPLAKVGSSTFKTLMALSAPKGMSTHV